LNYQNPIYTEKTQCQDCYKCIRECPVKAIRVENGHAMVVSGLCVLCGHCVTICPAGAKRVRDDQSRAKQLLTLRKRVIVSLAPSFAAEFPGIRSEQLVSAVKKLGFFGVSETAIGADLVSAQLAEDFGQTRTALEAGAVPSAQKLFLSSACPVAVEYIKLYMGEFSSCITDRASPLLAHARYLKKTYGEDTGIVFVGPCIAKKREADVWQDIDCAITFRDLKKWFADAGISPEAEDVPLVCGSPSPGGPTPFIPFKAAKGSLYPVDGGMIASIKKYPGTEGIHMMSVTGLDGIDKALRGLKSENLSTPLFMEILSCPGGCINGPQASFSEPTALRRMSLLEYAEHSADTLKETRPDMEGTLPVTVPPQTLHSDEEIRASLRQVGKFELKDELN